MLKRFTEALKNNKAQIKFIAGIMIGIFGMLAGIIIIISPFLKEKKREEVVKQNLEQIESIISDTSIEDKSFQIEVDTDELTIEGEYDGLTDEELTAIREELESTGVASLEAIGILEIPSLNIRLPFWDNADQISLRYGCARYAFSDYPGETGVCMILGHRMRNEDSMFHRLHEIQENATVSLTTLGGSIYDYEVYEISVVPAWQLLDFYTAETEYEEELLLVTCIVTENGTERFCARARRV